MQLSAPISWFNSPSLPTAPTFAPLALAPPTTPPAPSRRAPASPAFSPRRRRARHMRMQEPARKGLFTLTEEDESIASSSSTLSARASSELLRPSPLVRRLDLPQDAGMPGGAEDLVIMEERLSWKSASTSTSDTDCATPSPRQELDDPFFVDVPLDIDDDEADLDASYAAFLAGLVVPPVSRARPRRPPPLDLSRSHPYAYSAEINRWSADVGLATPKPTQALLPPLPILSPAEYQARCAIKVPRTPSKARTRHSPSTGTSASPAAPPMRKTRSAPPLAAPRNDPFDLVGALEDLLASSGENDDDFGTASMSVDLSVKAFPLPPPRTPLLSPTSASSSSSFSTLGGPTTPISPRHTSLPPLPPAHVPRHTSLPPLPPAHVPRPLVQPNFQGDHSFLFAMSGAPSPPPTSSRSGTSKSSRSSRKQLPPRPKIPMEWSQ